MLFRSHPEATVKSWILRSLKVPAARDVQNLGPRATVEAILDKLESMYGSVAPFETLMKEFFEQQQGKHEKVNVYVTRLEGLIAEMLKRYPERITPEQARQDLKGRLFQGLRKNLRDSLRYLYDTPGVTTKQLLTAARKAEAESEDTKVSGSGTSKGAADEEDPLRGVAREIGALKTEVRKNFQPKEAPKKPRPKGRMRPSQIICYKCKGRGHMRKQCPSPEEVDLNDQLGGMDEEHPSQANNPQNPPTQVQGAQ